MFIATRYNPAVARVINSVRFQKSDRVTVIIMPGTYSLLFLMLEYLIMRIIITIICFFLAFQLLGQKQANNWIFYIDNYISFNSGTPELITPPNGECIGWEAAYCDFFFSGYCGSTISDCDGNLLLYSNGEVVWNAGFDTIQYGDVFQGNMFSDQCILLPRPDHPTRYYLITTPFLNYLGGAKWSEIDISANNGLGSTLQPWNNLLMDSTTQKVTAVYHKNGKDIWILLHQFNNNAFHAYLLTSDGINTTPVISNVGTVHHNLPGNTGEHWGGAGAMKFSPNGKKVAVAIRGMDSCEVFDFDNETGIVSNPIAFYIDGPLSVEFSSNSTVLYISNEPLPINIESLVFQVDLLAGDSVAIVNSFDTITVGGNYFGYFGQGQLQLAQDGKVYHASGYEYSLSIITDPDSVGLNCNYDAQSFPISSSYCGSGFKQMLPNFFCSFLDRNILFENLCYGDSTLILTQTNIGFDSIRWEFEDPVGVLNNYFNVDSINHVFSEPGSYDIILHRYRNGFEDITDRMLYIKPSINISLGADTIICEGTTMNVQAVDSFVQFAWVNDINPDTIFSNSANIGTPGNWWPVLTNFDDYCGNIDTINVSLFLDSLNLGQDTSGICISNPLTLSALMDSATYLWSTGDTSSSIIASSNGTYMLTVQQGQCEFTDTILIQYDNELIVNLNDSIFFCDSFPQYISAGDFPADFIWSPGGETTADILIDSSGVYSVTASNGCGDFSDSTIAVMIEFPIVDLGNDTALCNGDTLSLSNLTPGNFYPSTYMWSTGDSISSIVVSDMGNYSLEISNVCGSDMDEILVNFEAPLVLVLNDDTTICLGSTALISPTIIGTGDLLWSTGETTPDILTSDSGYYYLTVTNACGEVYDSIHVSIHENQFTFPYDSIGIDTNQTVTLDAGPGYLSYLWVNMDTSQMITIGDPGNYWVEVVDSVGCTGSDTVIVYRTNGIYDHYLNKVVVYPNPVSDELIIEGLTGNESIRLFDLSGRILIEVIGNDIGNDNRAVLKLETIPTGQYYLNIGAYDKKMVFKIQKL